MYWCGTSNALSWSLHVALCSGRAWVQILQYQFFGDVGTPFEETLLCCFEERGYFWVAQGLVCKFHLVSCVEIECEKCAVCWTVSNCAVCSWTMFCCVFVLCIGGAFIALMGIVHKSVLGSLFPFRIVLPL